MLKPGSDLYFMGIGGTGMAAVAGLFQELGYNVTGSDAGVYPPMSTMLQELGIKVKTPYDSKNVPSETALIVIANVLSRGHPELEEALRREIPYTSFPQLLEDYFLKQRTSIVVTGTHGKTTTSSLMAHILHELQEDPSFIIGGIPRNFPRSFRLGKGPLVVIEGDEYDTAFFDKGPKFLHYCPKHLILNNLEFDHADIYADLNAIEKQFEKLVALVAGKERIIANMDDTGIAKLIQQLGLEQKVTRVAGIGKTPDSQVALLKYSAKALNAEEQLWTAQYQTKVWGTIELTTKLSGLHNLSNIAMIIGCIESMLEKGDIKNQSRFKTFDAIADAILSFKNVKRRLDHLGTFGGIDVYEDFAHHPTAVKLVIEGFKEVFPKKRLVIAFEPRSASQRRNVFQNDYARNLQLADLVYIGECPVDQRIPEDQRMNTKVLSDSIGSKARTFATNNDLCDALFDHLQEGDAVIFMSSGSFSNAQHRLVEKLRTRYA